MGLEKASEQKEKEANKKKEATKAAAREKERKRVLAKAQKLQESKTKEKQKYLAQMSKIANQRAEQLSHATNIAKAIGTEVQANQDSIADLINKVKKEEDAHKK